MANRLLRPLSKKQSLGQMKKFDPSGSLYDQSTYVGRFQQMLSIINPLTLFTSDNELRKAMDLLEAPDKTSIADEDLWAAKNLRDAIIHPDTKEKIFPAFRMSAFVPMNVPLVAGMISSSPTLFSTVFWQWANQSYNVAVNYANRNASNEMSMDKVAQAYAGAVAASCSIAVGLGEFAKKAPPMVKLFVPFTAVASAGALNVFLMRRNEIEEGITVKDSEGNVLGKSKVAGKQAIMQVAATRVILPIPVILFPSIIMKFVKVQNPRLRMLTELSVITGCLSFALPSAISLFPQESSIDVRELEPEFHNLRTPSGNPISTAYFNKGL